jgi:hypothetical protein
LSPGDVREKPPPWGSGIRDRSAVYSGFSDHAHDVGYPLPKGDVFINSMRLDLLHGINATQLCSEITGLNVHHIAYKKDVPFNSSVV